MEWDLNDPATQILIGIGVLLGLFFINSLARRFLGGSPMGGPSGSSRPYSGSTYASSGQISVHELRALFRTAAVGRGVPFGLAPPAETKIRYGQLRGEHAFALPNQRAALALVAFLSLWLAGWTYGIVTAIITLIESFSGPAIGAIVTTIFMLIWVSFAIVGEIIALLVLYHALVLAFGERYVLVNNQRVLLLYRLGPIGRRGFVEPSQIERLRVAKGALHLAGNRLPHMIVGITLEEARWLAQVIKSALSRPDIPIQEDLNGSDA